MMCINGFSTKKKCIRERCSYAKFWILISLVNLQGVSKLT